MTRGIVILAATIASVLAACGGSDSSSSSSGGVPCKGPSTDSDCVGTTTAKFDCSSASAQATAKAAGCVAEHPDDATDFDVCCPQGTTSTVESNQISCTGPTTDTDCVGAYANKFDCATDSASSDAKAKGCVSEHPNDPNELDVCCPAGVTQK